MSDINESFFSGEDDFNPFEITPFATEILNNYKKTVEKFEEGKFPRKLFRVTLKKK